MTFEPPEPWASAMIAAGTVDPRRKDTVPSITQLARRADVAVETVRRMIRGDGVPDAGSVRKVADALRADRAMVSQWVNQAREVHEDWAPPTDAALLNAEERAALDRLIRLMVAERKAVREGKIVQFPVDPAAGTGAFLEAAANRLTEADPDIEDYDVEAAHTSPEPAGLPEPESP